MREESTTGEAEHRRTAGGLADTRLKKTDESRARRRVLGRPL
jgi:hypothetical protein